MCQRIINYISCAIEWFLLFYVVRKQTVWFYINLCANEFQFLPNWEILLCAHTNCSLTLYGLFLYGTINYEQFLNQNVHAVYFSDAKFNIELYVKHIFFRFARKNYEVMRKKKLSYKTTYKNVSITGNGPESISGP